MRIRESVKAEECAGKGIARWNLYSIFTPWSYWLSDRYAF